MQHIFVNHEPGDPEPQPNQPDPLTNIFRGHNQEHPHKRARIPSKLENKSIPGPIPAATDP